MKGRLFSRRFAGDRGACCKISMWEPSYPGKSKPHSCLRGRAGSLSPFFLSLLYNSPHKKPTTYPNRRTQTGVAGSNLNITALLSSSELRVKIQNPYGGSNDACASATCCVPGGTGVAKLELTASE
jgi:hypothetical protein